MHTMAKCKWGFLYRLAWKKWTNPMPAKCPPESLRAPQCKAQAVSPQLISGCITRMHSPTYQEHCEG